MRKITLYTLVIVCLCLTFSGCSFFQKQVEPPAEDPSTLSKPEHAIIISMEGIKSADLETLKSSVVIPDGLLTEDVQKTLNNSLAQAAIKSLFKNLDYNVVSTTEDGDFATVTVDVTYPDLSGVITSNYNSFAPKIMEQIAAGTFDQKKTQNDILLAVAADLIAGKATESVSETIEVQCQKVDGKWRILPDKPIINVCTGGAITALDNLDYSLIIK